MSHPSDEQIGLAFYEGLEGPQLDPVRLHVRTCSPCGRAWARLEAEAREIASSLDPARARPAPWRRIAAAAAAALLAAAACLRLFGAGAPAPGPDPFRPPPERIARIAELDGAATVDGRPAGIGAEVVSSTSRPSSLFRANAGFVGVELKDGSYVELAEGGSLAVSATRGRRPGLELQGGRAYVEVAKGEERFSISTPGGSVIALGTRFELGLSGDRALEVRVWEGMTRVETAAGSAIAAPGEIVQTSPSSPPAKRIPAAAGPGAPAWRDAVALPEGSARITPLGFGFPAGTPALVGRVFEAEAGRVRVRRTEILRGDPAGAGWVPVLAPEGFHATDAEAAADARGPALFVLGIRDRRVSLLRVVLDPAASEEREIGIPAEASAARAVSLGRRRILLVHETGAPQPVLWEAEAGSGRWEARRRIPIAIPDLPDPFEPEILAVGGSVVLVDAGRKRSWWSADLERWTERALPAGPAISTVLSTGDGILAAGDRRLARTRDGERWEVSALPVGPGRLLAAAAGATILVVLDRSPRRHEALVSGDGGKTWERSILSLGVERVGPGAVLAADPATGDLYAAFPRLRTLETEPGAGVRAYPEGLVVRRYGPVRAPRAPADLKDTKGERR